MMELGNQQRSLDAKLNWLGGIIDGEGMITLIKRVGKGQNGYIPRISIVNTDTKIIDEVCSICEEIHVPHYVQKREATKTWKTKYEVLFNGIKRCNTFLPFILPVLVGKKDKAKLLMEFCEGRLSVPKGTEISNREHEIASLIRVRPDFQDNASNTFNDYTLNILKDEDIVCPE